MAAESQKHSKDVEADSPNGASNGHLARSPSRDHFWVEEVENGYVVPPEIRQRCKYTGLPHASVGHKPYLLATVRGVDSSGRPFTWIARRARKRVQQPHQCSEPPPPVSWLSTLSWKQAGKPGWWIALLFALGSLIFLMTGIARETEAVGQPEQSPPGLGSLAVGLSSWPENVACYFLFFPAVIIQMLEAANLDWECRVKAWQKGGGEGRRPRPRVLPDGAHLHTVSWWAALGQFLGMLCFNVGSTTDLVSAAEPLSWGVEKFVLILSFTLGGFCFMVAGWLACIEETGSWWRGLIPSRWSDVWSISWHATFHGFWGGVAFTVNGAGLYAEPSWVQQKWIVGFGHILGSILFTFSGLAGMLEQANPGHL